MASAAGLGVGLPALDPLAPAMGRDVLAWARVLRDGGPRTQPGKPETVRNYVAAVAPALAAWSDRYAHLREVTRDDVVAYLDTLRGRPRTMATTALRSLFSWAKRTNLIFGNPTGRIRCPRRENPIWQPLPPDQVAASIAAATTVQARLFLALAAIHAARPGQIRALHLDDVDLPGRRITLGGNSRPLDDLTHRLLLEWLTYRHRRPAPARQRREHAAPRAAQPRLDPEPARTARDP
ncbi:site-specific integrase [Micromonospora carbonacea]|uniref:site-specific integrase n=1 Tax=Micromonospora carbonacea TaxID=47853 RepID=UPI003D994345